MISIQSCGGGVQSTAMAVLSARGELPQKTIIFSNVGDDSENPATTAYIRDHLAPFCEKNGLEFIQLQKVRRDGSTETLMQHLMKPSASVGIPVRMNGNGAPGNRNCTMDFKIRVIDKWLREHGAKGEGAVVALGISMDEATRMRRGSRDSFVFDERFVAYPQDKPNPEWKSITYPLIDLRLRREDCQRIIADAGLPPAPKSSCFFCPFHNTSVWKQMKSDRPDLFQKSVELERLLNERRATLGKDSVWLSRSLVPLDEAMDDRGQLNLFDEEPGSCDIGGYCFA